MSYILYDKLIYSILILQKREKTKTFTIAIVDDAKSFETGDTKQVTATILDDDGKNHIIFININIVR